VYLENVIFLTIFFLHFVTHNLSLKTHSTSNQTTLYIHSTNDQIPGMKLGVPGNLDSMCYLHFVSHNHSLEIHSVLPYSISNQTSLYINFKTIRYQGLIGVPGKCNFFDNFFLAFCHTQPLTQNTLYIQSNHTLYSFNKRSNTRDETRCTWKF
jgi:hypothetical protein